MGGWCEGPVEIRYHPLGEAWATCSWDRVLPRGAGYREEYGVCQSVVVWPGHPEEKAGWSPEKDWEEKLGMFG